MWNWWSLTYFNEIIFWLFVTQRAIFPHCYFRQEILQEEIMNASILWLDEFQRTLIDSLRTFWLLKCHQTKECHKENLDVLLSGWKMLGLSVMLWVTFLAHCILQYVILRLSLASGYNYSVYVMRKIVRSIYSLYSNSFCIFYNPRDHHVPSH